jgi:predicted transcriptional regulator
MELRDQVDASNAAVYQEINRLAESEFIREINGVWELTGRGYLTLSILQMQERADALLERDIDEDYWTTHDPSIVPVPFQATFNLLADCEMIRASERDTAMWRVAEQIDAAHRIDLVGKLVGTTGTAAGVARG